MYRSFRGWSGCMPPARGDSADTVYQRSAWAARSPDFGEGRRGRSGRESAPIDIATCSHGLVQSAQGAPIAAAGRPEADGLAIDRKSVGSGKRVSVRVDIGGRRPIKKKKNKE